jgi:hypothetical protein
MVDVTEEQQDKLDAQAPTEIEMLRARAKTLGLSHHPSMGLDKLKLLVKEAMEPKPSEEAPIVEIPVQTTKPAPKAETTPQRRARLHKEATRLVRCVVSCMNPRKQEQEFQMFSVSNSVIGTITKVVPFDVEEGFHIPKIILDNIEEAQCQVFHTVKGPRGNKVRKGKLVKEFSVRVLKPLTTKELDTLARDQKQRNNLED